MAQEKSEEKFDPLVCIKYDLTKVVRASLDDFLRKDILSLAFRDEEIEDPDSTDEDYELFKEVVNDFVEKEIWEEEDIEDLSIHEDDFKDIADSLFEFWKENYVDKEASEDERVRDSIIVREAIGLVVDSMVEMDEDDDE